MPYVVIDANALISSWSDLRPDIVDAAILAVAISNRYDLATFDRKLANRAKSFGVTPYW